MTDLWLLHKPHFTQEMQARIERLFIENNQVANLDKDIFEALVRDSNSYAKIYADHAKKMKEKMHGKNKR